MAFDTGQQEAAQRYYIQALRLARAAADVPLGGYVLASMSLQATYRGFADEGVDLAQAALERNRGLATARTMSFFRLVEARAHAQARERARRRGGAEGRRGLAGAGPRRRRRPVLARLLLLRPVRRRRRRVLPRPEAPRQVRRFTEQALSQPTEEFVRSHGLRLVVSAVAELESGNLDAACERACGRSRSPGGSPRPAPRSTSRDLLHRLEPYGDEPRVRRTAGAGPAAAGGSGVKAARRTRRAAAGRRPPRRLAAAGARPALNALSVAQCTIGPGGGVHVRRPLTTATCW